MKGIVPDDPLYFTKYCKGLFDAEGSIIRQDKKRVCLRISQKDQNLLHIVRVNLIRIGISVTRVFRNDNKGTYVIQIPNYSVYDFIKYVGSNHPLKLEAFYRLGLLSDL